MNAHAVGDPTPHAFSVRLFEPPPLEQGLKLDWTSPIGRTGFLLDWIGSTPPVDAGVPSEVARVLATALCGVFTVSGCTVHVPVDLGAGWAPIADGHARRFTRAWWSRPRTFGVVATQDPNRTVAFFDEDWFAWAQESQLLMLSPPGALPDLSRELLDACFANPIAVAPAQLSAASVTGLVVPGVDGDMAGVYISDREQRVALVCALADATRTAGGRWEEHDGSTHWSTRAAGPAPADASR